MKQQGLFNSYNFLLGLYSFSFSLEIKFLKRPISIRAETIHLPNDTICITIYYLRYDMYHDTLLYQLNDISAIKAFDNSEYMLQMNIKCQ